MFCLVSPWQQIQHGNSPGYANQFPMIAGIHYVYVHVSKVLSAMTGLISLWLSHH
jgi:hypothetical protein